MSYSSEVAADSPSVYYPLHSVSAGVWADSSGNGRDLDTTSGTAPTLDSTGGPDGLGAMVFGASAGFIRTSAAITAPTVGTYEAWVYLPSSPTAEIGIAAWSPTSGSDGTSSLLRVRSDGKISSYTTPEDLVSPSALGAAGWHHIIASWGAAGHKIRIDKSTVATGTDVDSPAIASCSFRLHGFYFSPSDLSETGAIKYAHVAFYPTQLTDARTDAHYDAILPSPDATVTPPVATAAASASVPVVSASSSVASPVATASASAPVPTVDNGAGSASVAAPAATATASAPVPTITQVIPAGTDTTNFLNGRNRRARASVTVIRPVGTAPSNLAPRHDKAVPLPPPTLVNGRVT